MDFLSVFLILNFQLLHRNQSIIFLLQEYYLFLPFLYACAVLVSRQTASTCVDRIIRCTFQSFHCTLGVKNVALLSDVAAKN